MCRHRGGGAGGVAGGRGGVAGVSKRPCTALEVCLAGSSSSGELRAGRTGPTTNALAWPQTAFKWCASIVRVSQSCNFWSLPVRLQRKMMSVVVA